ncbi:MAG: hypothetical protein QMC96_09275 [Methanomicrobiales archaeon]|nr:hypothetical protein [Methanomicrobiales archaeon]
MLFEALLERLPDRSLILVEDDIGFVKTIFAERLASKAASAGWQVRYITAGYKEDVQAEMRMQGLEAAERIEFSDRFRDRKTLAANCTGDLCIVDAITTLLSDAGATEVAGLVDSLLDASRQGRIILMLADRGVLQAGTERYLHVRADGVIQFGGSGEGRFMRILKMKGSWAASEVSLRITEAGTPLLEEKQERGSPETSRA